MACTQYGRRPRLVQVVRKGQRPQTGLLRGGLAYVKVRLLRSPPKVLKLVGQGQSYREISHRLGLSENTVLDIVKRDRAA